MGSGRVGGKQQEEAGFLPFVSGSANGKQGGPDAHPPARCPQHSRAGPGIRPARGGGARQGGGGARAGHAYQGGLFKVPALSWPRLRDSQRAPSESASLALRAVLGPAWDSSE